MSWLSHRLRPGVAPAARTGRELERFQTDALAAMALACSTAGLAGSAARGELRRPGPAARLVRPAAAGLEP